MFMLLSKIWNQWIWKICEQFECSWRVWMLRSCWTNHPMLLIRKSGQNRLIRSLEWWKWVVWDSLFIVCGGVLLLFLWPLSTLRFHRGCRGIQTSAVIQVSFETDLNYQKKCSRGVAGEVSVNAGTTVKELSRKDFPCGLKTEIVASEDQPPVILFKATTHTMTLSAHYELKNCQFF